MFNKCIFVGRIASQVEVLKSKAGKKYVKFCLAVNRINLDADFFSCVAFEEKIVKALQQPYIKKGLMVLVEGRFNISEGSYSVCLTDFRYFPRAEAEYLNSREEDMEDFEKNSREKVNNYNNKYNKSYSKKSESEEEYEEFSPEEMADISF